MRESPYKHLKQKSILNILIGSPLNTSVVVGDTTIEASMPYLTGPQICELSAKLGNPIHYPLNGGAPSRWKLFENLLDFCIQNEKEELLIQELFKPYEFNRVLYDCDIKDMKLAYEKIIDCVLEHINRDLYFCGHQIRRIGNNIYVCTLDAPIAIISKKINAIDHNYIKELVSRTADDINMGNYDSVLTKSRTLLEEVFCFVLEKKGIEHSNSGKITDLYGQVKQAYGMKQDNKFDKRINNLLSGFEKILTSISEMRNEQSDAHGVGANRIKIAQHHAQLFVNAAIIMADFMLSVSEKQNNI